MPTRTDEEWRRTDLRRLRLDEIEPFAEDSDAAGNARCRQPSATSASPASLASAMARRVEYSFDEELAAPGRHLHRSGAPPCASMPDLVREYFMTRCVPPEDSKFAALHGAFWDNGVFLYVPRGVAVEHPLRAVISAGLQGTSSLSHTLIVLDEGSHAVYAEDYHLGETRRSRASARASSRSSSSGTRTCTTSARSAGAGRSTTSTPSARCSDRTRTSTSQTIELGSQLSKGRVESVLEGDGANVKLLGLYIEDGNQHLDRYTLQDHIGQAGVSDLLFKGVLTDKARSVFSGLIRVHPTGKKTAAYQQNRNLLLSRTARADSIPNLEIAASDIIGCTHGATVGKVDEEQLFYLMCRGLTRVGGDTADRRGLRRPDHRAGAHRHPARLAAPGGAGACRGRGGKLIWRRLRLRARKICRLARFCVSG